MTGVVALASACGGAGLARRPCGGGPSRRGGTLASAGHCVARNAHF